MPMQEARIVFTAVFLKSQYGYTGFVQELPGVNSHGRTLAEAREMLRRQAAVVFQEERRVAEELLAGREAVRELFSLPARRG